LRYHPSTALTGQLFGHWRYAGNILANNIGVWYEVDSFTNGGGEDGSGTVTSTSEADPLPDEHMIFPVPAHDVLNITNAGPRPTDYRVYNCTGSLIVEGSAGATSSLWTADWPSGTYIIIFNTKGSTSHRSFVVDH
jgi:hypothetical protein